MVKNCYSFFLKAEIKRREVEHGLQIPGSLFTSDVYVLRVFCLALFHFFIPL